MDKIWWKDGQNLVERWTKFGGKMVKIWWKDGQNLVERWTKFGGKMDKIWWKDGQNLVERWSKFGSTLPVGKRWKKRWKKGGIFSAQKNQCNCKKIEILFLQYEISIFLKLTNFLKCLLNQFKISLLPSSLTTKQ